MHFIRHVFAASLALAGFTASAQSPADPLAASFKTPPDAARPRTWWHWTQSNVTKEGITKDLEWMKRVGIGGFMLADVGAGGGQNVETKTPFGTPEWFDAVRHAAAEADRLGLEMSIFSSPGWSETSVTGPQKFSGKLASPPNNIGQIRNTGAGYYSSDSKEPPFDARFRVAGRQAELFHPDTGATEPADYAITGDRTVVPLRLAERESVFVVFRGTAASPTRTTAPATSSTIATIDGAWTVSFPEKLGAPASLSLAKLEPLSTHAEAGVKYFSGTATYTKTINAPRKWFRSGAATLLDLGRVGDIAEISINGRALGQLWKSPYRLDVTTALKPGENKIEIKDTNQWTNRIAGDRAAPADQKILAAAPPGRGGGGGFGGAAAALPESGLIGPVTIILRQ